jgi:hypothetical protein
MIFSAEVNVQIANYQGLVKMSDYPRSIAFISIDAPDFDGAISDMKNMCKQISEAHLQKLAETEYTPDFGSQRISITVFGKIAGFETRQSAHLDKELYEKLREQRLQPDKPKLNEESLKNDIEYGINMLRSTLNDKEWITNPPVVWQYYILQKHFGIPVPKELREQANNLQK